MGSSAIVKVSGQNYFRTFCGSLGQIRIELLKGFAEGYTKGSTRGEPRLPKFRGLSGFLGQMCVEPHAVGDILWAYFNFLHFFLFWWGLVLRLFVASVICFRDFWFLALVVCVFGSILALLTQNNILFPLLMFMFCHSCCMTCGRDRRLTVEPKDQHQPGTRTRLTNKNIKNKKNKNKSKSSNNDKSSKYIITRKNKKKKKTRNKQKTKQSKPHHNTST